MTVDSLKDCNKKVLAQMAKDQGIVGWHAMRKDQLIRALSPPPATAKKVATKATAAGEGGERPSSRQRPRGVAAPTAAGRARPDAGRAAAAAAGSRLRQGPDHRHGPRPVLAARLLGAEPSTLARAQAALGQEWHTARPILRLMDVTSEDTTAASERHVRDIEIHGGVNNWYIDVMSPPRSFRIDIGYLARRGKFFVLARSNVVTTPKAGVSDIARRELGERPGAVPADLPPVGRRQRLGRLARPPRPVRGAAPPADAQPLAPEPGHRRLDGARPATSTSRSTPS